MREGKWRRWEEKVKNNHNIITIFDVFLVIVFLFKFDKRSKTFVVKKTLLDYILFVVTSMKEENVERYWKRHHWKSKKHQFNTLHGGRALDFSLALQCLWSFISSETTELFIFQTFKIKYWFYDFFFSYTLALLLVRRLKISISLLLKTTKQ